ncbi:MAG: response regulator [Thermodesulfobacteriota bacterium]
MSNLKSSVTTFFHRLIPANIKNDDQVRKAGLMFGSGIIGIICLTLLGVIAFIQGGMLLGTLDLAAAVVLTVLLLVLHLRGNLSFCIHWSITLMYFLYTYLLVSGGITGTAFLWSYTFPLIAMFLLGSKRGFQVTSVYFLTCLGVMLIDINTVLINLYTKDLTLRFSASFVVVFLFSHIYEKYREESQAALLESKSTLEEKVQERTRVLEQEIHKRRQIEQELRYSENRFRHLVESAADAIFMFDKHGKFEVVNAEACLNLCYAEEELLQLSVTDIDEELSEEDIVEITSSGSQKRWPITIRGMHRRKDGTRFPVEVRIDTLERKNGHHFVAVARDISDRIRTEKQIIALNNLREKLLGLGSLEKKLSVVTEAVVDIFEADFCRIWLVRPGDLCDSGCPHAAVSEGPHICRHRGRCLHLAAGSGRYTGVKSKMHGRVPFGCYKIGRVVSGELPGFNTNDVVNDPRIHDHEWARELGLVSFTGFSLFAEDGSPLGVLAMFSKHTVGPNEVGLIEGVANSISQVIQVTVAEEEKGKIQSQLARAQKMEAIGLMAGGVAHDLNNILAGIVGYPDLLLSQLSSSSELKKPMTAIKESGERAAAVVADLLTVARGSASIRESHDINKLAREYLGSPEYKALKILYPGVNCRLECRTQHPHISCSPVHIKKIIMNLVTNGMEAVGEKGSVVISTANHHTDEAEPGKHGLNPGAYVCLTVADDGPGIASQDIDHIFEPFYTKKFMGHSGSGLGLAIVWNTVQDHNGRIFVDSNDQQTSFELYFPAGEKTAVAAADEMSQEWSSSHERILVVDDEEMLRDIASQMLQSMGYLVDSVSSGELAVEYLKEKAVDLFVIDMLMEPGINGRQTYERLLEINQGQRAIIASGFSESEDVRAALKMGAGGFIKKPYSLNQLERVVKEVLNSGIDS